MNSSMLLSEILALGLMVVSGVAPLLWFRRKGWF